MAIKFRLQRVGFVAVAFALFGATGCAGATSAAATPASGDRVAWFPSVAEVSTDGSGTVDPKLVEVAKNVLATGDPAAIAQLRKSGPAGLFALLSVDDGSAKAATLIDAVAKQRDARASQLYWHTDLESAKAAAQASGKPILSLRMLGQLDHKLSCANSRFFRTVLYPNARVSNYLRQRFVLHWSSERPVPKVNIDFGDGRKLETTITGNSIHYVLDQQGRFVDGLPGLYGPTAFVGSLENAAKVAEQVGLEEASRRQDLLIAFHSGRAATITRAWEADLAFLGVTAPASLDAPLAPEGTDMNAPSAALAVPVAAPKAAAELPMVAGLSPSPPTLEEATTSALWNGIAERHASVSKLDRATLAILKAKSPPGLDAATLATRATKFQQLMALDTVRNEYLLHRQIHRWVAAGEADESHLAVNSRVYRELFLTPSTDPYLGLVNPSTYTGLENDGLLGASAQPQPATQTPPATQALPQQQAPPPPQQTAILPR